MRLQALVTALALAPAAMAAQSEVSIAEAVASITPEDVRHHIGVIAHDSMLGRYTPSPGLDMTAEYVAEQFASLGLAPGGDDGSYLQRYAIQQVQLNTAASAVRVEGGPTWMIGEDLLQVFGGLGEAVSGPAVVVNADGDLSELGPEDVAGRVVFVIAGQAGGQVFDRLFEHRPPAVIVLQPMPDAVWNRTEQRQARPTDRVGAGGGDFVVLRARDATVAPVLLRHGVDVERLRAGGTLPTVTRLDDLRVSVEMQFDVVSEQSAPNVVGILEGSDPVLRHEYLVFSAHMDHSGVTSRPVNGDSILNGADDDASGTIAIVELAEAFALLEPRPKRSIIFLTVSGEERGLWGSEYFATNPPVPVEQMVANVNADMVGRNWPDTIVVIGKEHSDLGATLNRVNGEHPELNMTAIDDLWPDENFYYRSDHIHFARRGVPILFFFNGTHEDYHRPSDEVEKVDAEKESRIVQLMFYLGLDILNAAERPQWYPESYERIVTDGI